MSFIEIPNLPAHDVKEVLISSKVDKDTIRCLKNMGIDTIIVPPCDDIAPPVSSHADMLFHHLGDNKMVYYRGADYDVCQQLVVLGFELIKCNAQLGPQYPDDIALNAARVGNYLFCNERYTDKSILEYCKDNQIHILSVKQGYSKCSACIVNENSIITSDKSIEMAAKKCGMSVLFIRAGFIDLPGYDFGFIGGCCVKLSCDKMLFYGDISRHPDYSAIRNFLVKRGIKIEILGGTKLCDIGSIIPLIQSDL